MTASVRAVLNKICYNDIFKDELYFIGGTALAYYLSHRISEDIDIVCVKTLNHKLIVPNVSALGGIKLQDENVTALRMAGLSPDEYMIKFVMDNVKLEFFQANRKIQKEILSESTFTQFEESKLKVLDIKSIAKLKLVALIMRNKSRDLFDFGSILEQNVLDTDEIIALFSKLDSKIGSLNSIITFIQEKKEPLDDEAVYLSENNRIDLSFEDIKEQVIRELNKGKKS